MRASNVFNVRASVIRRVWSALLIGCMSLGWAAAATVMALWPMRRTSPPTRRRSDGETDMFRDHLHLLTTLLTATTILTATATEALVEIEATAEIGSSS